MLLTIGSISTPFLCVLCRSSIHSLPRCVAFYLLFYFVYGKLFISVFNTISFFFSSSLDYCLRLRFYGHGFNRSQSNSIAIRFVVIVLFCCCCCVMSFTINTKSQQCSLVRVLVVFSILRFNSIEKKQWNLWAHAHLYVTWISPSVTV